MTAAGIALDAASARHPTLTLEEYSRLAGIDRLHAALASALAEGVPLSIDGSRVAEIDTATLQLLASAWGTWRSRGLLREWRAPSQALQRAARSSGLQGLLGLSDSAATPRAAGSSPAARDGEDAVCATAADTGARALIGATP